MSEKKYANDDPERTLITLDQLSQTIEVMTSVVNRLRRHLSDQIKAQGSENYQTLPVESAPKSIEQNSDSTITTNSKQNSQQAHSSNNKREGFVVEINQQEVEAIGKATKVLH